ncbi:MAG: hypothetical protein AAGI53_08940 [Planctomycetota bacterium]
MPRHARSQAALCVALGLAWFVVSGCSSPETLPTFGTGGDTTPGLGTPRERLGALADQEVATDRIAGHTSLRSLAERLPIPDRPVPGEHASEPLADAIARLASEPLDGVNVPESVLSDLDRSQALTAYANGREALIRGDFDAAIDDLERATALDPAAPEAWRALAEAQLARNLRASAMVSFERAIGLGLEEPRALTLAGIDALGRRQTARAARLLARAESTQVLDSDPGLVTIRRAALGEAMLDQGRLLAGAQLIASAVGSRPQFSSVTKVGPELGTLFRRRPALLLSAGDAFAAVGFAKEADESFFAAKGLPGANDAAIAARRLALALEAGRPALAALLLVERFETSGGLANAQDVDLATAITDAAPTPVVVALRDAVGSLIATSEDPTPTRRLGLVRLHAATGDAQDRRAIRLAALADARFGGPNEAALLADDLFKAVDSDDPAAIATLVGLACEAQPRHARIYVEIAARIAADPAALFALLDADDNGVVSVASRLFAGRERAIDTTPGALTAKSGAGESTLAAMLVAAAFNTGRWDDVESHLASFSAMNDRPERVTALLAAQCVEQAAGVARAIASDPEARAWQLLVATDALRIADADGEASETAERALAEDPLSEAAFERVLALRSASSQTGGPTPDDAARELRERRPDGPLLRLLMARELIRRQLRDEAERRLEDLANENPFNTGLLDQQVVLAARQSAARTPPARIEASLRETLAQSPGALYVAQTLAAVLAGDGRPDEAVTALQETIERTGVGSLNRPLERALRQASRHDEADVLRRARLETEPRSIGSTLELASLLAAGKADWASASDRPSSPASVLALVGPSVPEGVSLTDAQRGNAALTLVRAIARVPNEPSEDDAPALALLAWAAEHEVPMSPRMHGQRIAILGRTNAGVPQIADAVRLSMAQHPASATDFLEETTNAFRGERRFLDAAFLTGELLLFNEPVLPQALHSEFFRVMVANIGAADDADGARILIDRIVEVGRTMEVLSAINFTPGEDEYSEGPAALAYTAAAFTRFNWGDENAEAYYLLALEYDPEHVWAANDLGYQLLERGVRPDDANRLIELAAARSPDQHNIIDSLGWLRYHQGRLTTSEDIDIDDPDRLLDLGAVDLLRMAVNMLGPKAARTDDGVLDDHLGDALASAGRYDEARSAWVAARDLASRTMRTLSLNQQVDTPGYRDAKAMVEAADQKIRAIDAGREPSLPRPVFAPAVPE